MEKVPPKTRRVCVVGNPTKHHFPDNTLITPNEKPEDKPNTTMLLEPIPSWLKLDFPRVKKSQPYQRHWKNRTREESPKAYRKRKKRNRDERRNRKKGRK